MHMTFYAKNIDYRTFFTSVPLVRVHCVFSVEHRHLADWHQLVAKDINYFQHNFQEHHYCLKYFQITFRAKMSIVGVFDGGTLSWGIWGHFSLAD